MDIKFQFLYEGAPFHGGTKEFNWHKKVYSLDQLISTKLSNLCDVHNTSTLIAKRQFTGLKDKNGVDIYEGDIVKHHFNGDEKYSIGKVVYGRSHDEGGELRECVGFFRVAVGSNFYRFNGQDIKVYDCGTPMTYGLRELEVVGNIYQNPELIENNN